MSLEYYVYSNGGTARDVLNAIATFFATPTFGSLVSISLMFSVVATLMTFFISRNPASIYKWAAVYFIVPMFLINMKTDMQVIDLTEPNAVRSVSNVPYITAIPTWFASSLMHGMTETIEAVLSQPGDERYGKTGMMFGSRLYQLSRQSNIREVELKGYWSDYFHNCLVGDILINKKYTWDELYAANDIWDFLDTKSMSPLRGVFFGRGNYYTCKDAYPLIKAKMNQAANKDITYLGSYLYGKRASANASFLNTSLSSSYQRYNNISTNASKIMRQNMTMNAIRNGTLEMNATASALNYAYTQNKMQTTSMWAGIALQAKEYMPLLHTTLFILFSCVSLFVAVAALIPSLTVMVLTNYVKTFIVLGIWPALFAILNYIMISALSYTTEGITDSFNGITLSNESALDEMHTRFALLSGYLMMSVPLIAGAILKGGSAVMSSLNYQMAGMINSTNSRTSAAAASGDVNLGNMQVDNRSWANQSANKHDTNLLERMAGQQSTQQADGSTYTQLASGQSVYNTGEAVSNLHWNVGSNQDVQQSLNDNYQTAVNNTQSYSSQLNENIQSGMALQSHWSNNMSEQKSYGEGYNTGAATQISQGTQRMDSASDTLSNEMGWSKDKSNAFLQSTSGSIYARAEGNLSTPAALKALTGASGSLTAGLEGSYRITDEDRETFSNMSSERIGQVQSAMSQYSEGANDILSASSQIDNKAVNSELDQYVQSFTSNWNQSEGLVNNVSQSQAESQNLSTAMSNIEQSGISLKENLMPSFQRFVEENAGEKNASSILTSTGEGAIAARQGMWEDYQKSDDFKNDVFALAGVNIPTTMNNTNEPLAFNAHQTNRRDAHEMKTVSYFTQNTDRMAFTKQSDDLFDKTRFDDIKNDTLSQQEDTRAHINPLEKREPSSPAQPETHTNESQIKPINTEDGYHYHPSFNKEK